MLCVHFMYKISQPSSYIVSELGSKSLEFFESVK